MSSSSLACLCALVITTGAGDSAPPEVLLSAADDGWAEWGGGDPSLWWEGTWAKEDWRVRWCDWCDCAVEGGLLAPLLVPGPGLTRSGPLGVLT